MARGPNRLPLRHRESVPARPTHGPHSPSCSGQAGAVGRSRPADRRAEVHHRLREIAGALLGGHRVEELAQLRLALGHGRFEPIQPGDDPLDVGVHHEGTPAERDRGDRGRRIVADAGQSAKLVLGRRETASRRDLARAGDQVPRAGVIAKARPFREHVLVARRGERLDRRPAREESLESRRHGRDGRLLEHHLAQPHAIGIGSRFARHCAPRKAPGVIHIMLEQAVGGHARPMA